VKGFFYSLNAPAQAPRGNVAAEIIEHPTHAVACSGLFGGL
jgi:hypothetical protein